MKFAVGVMLSSFGMFWGAEGAGATWPGGDAALLALIPGVLFVAMRSCGRCVKRCRWGLLSSRGRLRQASSMGPTYELRTGVLLGPMGPRRGR